MEEQAREIGKFRRKTEGAMNKKYCKTRTWEGGTKVKKRRRRCKKRIEYVHKNKIRSRGR